MKLCILAVDPGNEKTGLAIVNTDLSCPRMLIVDTIAIEEQLHTLKESYHFCGIACGNGTNHKKVFALLSAWGKTSGISAHLVEESYSTEEARTRYWEYNTPTGLKRLFPKSFLFPPVPVDDFTAWIIGERFWKSEVGAVLQDTLQ